MKNLNKQVPEATYNTLRAYAFKKNITMKQALIDAINLLTKGD